MIDNCSSFYKYEHAFQIGNAYVKYVSRKEI